MCSFLSVELYRMNIMKKSIFTSNLLSSIRPSSVSSNQSKDGIGKQTCCCQSGSPQAIKIAPFWGADDHIMADDWIDLYDAIASDHGYSSTNKIVRLGGHLRKHALAWYVDTIKQPGDLQLMDWLSVKEMFVRYFSYNSPMERGSDMSSTVSSAGR